ncbi:MAG: mechanosensitive ion channel family protein [Bryobacteraceae bacterium]
MWDNVNVALTEATRRVVMGVAGFLPGLLALLVALVVAVIFAVIVGSILRRSLRRINFDARLEQWGMPAIAEWSPRKSPTLLVGKICTWGIVLMGLLIGLTALEANLTSRLVVGLFGYLPNVLAAALLIVVGTLVARFLARGLLISAVNMRIQSARLLSLGVKWLVLVLSTAMALEHLRIGGGLVKLAFGILFGGIVLALALAVGLGSKEAVSRSWEETKDGSEEPEETFHHL